MKITKIKEVDGAQQDIEYLYIQEMENPGL